MLQNSKVCLQTNSTNYALIAEYASSRQNPFDINMNAISDSKANHKRRGLFVLNGVFVLE
jgi:hypothetical protein